MKRTILMLFFVSIIAMQASNISLTLLDSKATVSGNYELKSLQERTLQGETYIQIKSIEEATIGTKGQAELPAYSEFVMLPNTGNFVLKEFQYEYDEIKLDKKIIPNGWEDKERVDSDYYNSNDWFPQEPVLVSKPNIMRGVRFSQITISKVQYNPALNTLRVLKNIQADFRLDNSITTNSLKTQRNYQANPFSKISQETITGFEPQRTNQVGSYLFICPDHVVSNLSALKNHKEKLGFRTKIAPLSETGSTNNEIKSYLQNAYDTWEFPPKYVILVGDVSGSIIVPTFFVEGSNISPNNASDHPYTLLEGDDYFPDIMIGRISVQTTMNLVTVINKIINYESNPYPGDWHTKSLVIAPVDLLYQTEYVSHKETKMVVRDKLLDFTNSVVDTFYYNYQGGPNQIESLINTGYSFVNFRGHGGPNYWNLVLTSYFEIENVENLNNGFMLPFVTSMTCATGDFANSFHQVNFGETWLIGGTPSNPKGAIGLIGPSEHDTVVRWNNANDMGIYQGITQEQLFRGGEMLLRGKMELYQNYPNFHEWGGPDESVQFYFYVYNLLGDPGLAVWTDTPQDIVLEIDNEMITGENFLNAKVITDAPDKSGFKIAITNADSLIAKGFTNENGEANIPVALSSGIYQVTASGYGFIPATEELQVAKDDIIALENYVFSEALISDETINITCSIVNKSNYLIENITAELVSNDAYLQVLSESVSINELDSLQTTDIDFQFSIGNEWKNGDRKELFVTIISESGENEFLIPLEIQSPELVVSDFSVDNSDNCLLPNSLHNVSFQLYNTSSVATNDISVVLSSQNDKTDITQSNSYYGTIQSGSSGTNQNQFQISVNDVIEGELAKYSLQIFQNENLVSETFYSTPIGIISEKSPTFSEYGYFAIECRDEGNFGVPEYDWIEIDPALGGSGTLVEADFSQYDGFLGVVDLPFPFQYFAVSYDKISICSNGYITMGESDLIFFRNRIIPSGVGSPAMIAPFWDNLVDGNIYTWYDSDNHYFVVQWSEFQNVHDPDSKETFQVLFYDSEHHPTPTNDGKLKFQYKEINNVDTVENYATVGIESQYQNDGILITFANFYSNTAHLLQNETAILFTNKENFTIPFLSIEQPSIRVTLPENSETTQSLLLTNKCSGDENLTYAIELSNFRKNSPNPPKRSIENDRIMLFTPQYYTTHPINIMFYLVHNSPDNEAVSGVKINFPEGFVVHGADNIGSLNWNGETGDGAEVTWGFGNGQNYTQTTPQAFYVHVTIAEDCTQPEEISWLIQGDGTGAEPHVVDGVETIVPSENSYIWITYPEEANVMVYGLQDSIKWQAYGDMDDLNLYWRSEHVTTWEILSSNFENNGYHEFTVPGPLAENCRLKLSSLDGETYDTTSEFRITALNITYPENNTIMMYSTKDSLKWVDTGGLENIDIYLSTNNGMDWDLFAANVENTGSYEFDVPGPPSNQCLFKLSSSDGLIYNMSPIFEITDAPIDWFYLDSYSGIIQSNETKEIGVILDSNHLAIGNYSAFITITTNHGQKYSIPIELEVVEEQYDNFHLYGNYPNPFSISTNLSFSLPQHTQKATVTIYNIKGQKVRTIQYIPTAFQASHSINWDGRDDKDKKVGSGIYFYTLKAENKNIGNGKCILLK